MTTIVPWESKICRSCFSQKPVCPGCERCAECDEHRVCFDVNRAFDAAADAAGNDE